MHPNSITLVKYFFDKYLDKNKRTKILEVGSLSIKPPLSLKDFIESPLWEYSGMDIVKGYNVDIVSEDPYHYPFDNNSFDVVVSISTLEHVEDIYSYVREMARVTKDLLYINAPNRWHLHRCPLDCWRIFPDGMNFLLGKIAGLQILECDVRTHDTYGIGRKIIKNL